VERRLVDGCHRRDVQIEPEEVAQLRSDGSRPTHQLRVRNEADVEVRLPGEPGTNLGEVAPEFFDARDRRRAASTSQHRGLGVADLAEIALHEEYATALARQRR
jgi:hypothetical protein